MPDIFLSYSRDDQATARRFADGFERAGFTVWWDQALNAGEAFDRVTEKALEDASAVVVLWSKRSVDSNWVRAEAAHADERSALVPVLIEPCSIPVKFRLTQTADLTGWNGSQDEPRWRQFIEGLRRFAGNEATTPPPPPQSTARSSKRIGVIAIAALALLLVGGGIWWALSRGGATPTAPSAEGGTTLAVLPFANLSADPDQEYFSDGLTEEILNQLAQIRDLAVTGRTSSFSFKGRNEDLRVIAQALGVANLLEGSIRKDGDELRITAQLINGKDGTHLWSKTYDRKLSGVFALQEEVAKDVAQALQIKLDVGDTSRARGGTTNLDAYEKYLRAQDASNRGNILAGMQLFHEAVALDPNFALAWLGIYKLAGPAAAADPQAAAQILLERRTTVAEKLKVLPLDEPNRQSLVANAHREKHEWAEALAAARAVQTSAPSFPGGHALAGLVLWSVGQTREAEQAFRRTQGLDPFATWDWLYNLYASMGQKDQALLEFDRVMKLNYAVAAGTSPTLNFSDSLTAARVAGPVSFATFQAMLKAQPGSQGESSGYKWLANVIAAPDEAEALRQLRKAIENPAMQSEGPLITIVIVADMLGDKELMIDALSRNYVELKSGFVPAIWFATQTPIRNEPAFKDMLRKLGLVDYWRSTGNWGDYCKPVGDTDFECQ